MSEVVSENFDIPSFHLAEPLCHGDIYQKYNRGNSSWCYRAKVKAIVQTAKKGNGNYFESTPVFVRGFSHRIIKSKYDVGVIQLLRDPMEVAKSFANRESYPSHVSRPWRLPLGLERSLIHLDGDEILTPFQENLLDWVENELRLEALRPVVSDVKVLRFEDLSNKSVLIDLMEAWGLPRLSDVTVKDLDKNENPKSTIIEPDNMEDAEKLVRMIRRTDVDRSIFANSSYDGFEFIEKLRN